MEADSKIDYQTATHVFRAESMVTYLSVLNLVHGPTDSSCHNCNAHHSIWRPLSRDENCAPILTIRC
jgi:hypothetical protein